MTDTGMKKFEEDREMTLALPIKKSDLGNFVADLLGQLYTALCRVQVFVLKKDS